MISKNLNKAVDLLLAGELVSFPTETVYGLGADAKNPEALSKIFKAKGRPSDHPLIVHIGTLTELSEWAIDINPDVLRLAEAFWPGPLTFILNKSPNVHDLVTGRQSTVGLRMPNNPIALQLLQGFGSGLAAPSANKFGAISPTTAAAVQQELGNDILVLDGGACEVGLESTILDLSTETPRILRPGMLGIEAIEQVLKKPVLVAHKNVPRVSGSLESHYSPKTKSKLLTRGEILEYLKKNREAESIGLLLLESFETKVYSKCLSKNPKQYAHDLYAALRDLDQRGFREIIIEKMPDDSAWSAILDRLKRATS